MFFWIEFRTMAKLYFLPQHDQVQPLKPGDWVRYVGSEPKIQQDYGNQNLRIVAIDPVSPIAVCDSSTGQRLVGVALGDLHRAGQSNTDPPIRFTPAIK
jgi:hypothetical protein